MLYIKTKRYGTLLECKLILSEENINSMIEGYTLQDSIVLDDIVGMDRIRLEISKKK